MTARRVALWTALGLLAVVIVWLLAVLFVEPDTSDAAMSAGFGFGGSGTQVTATDQGDFGFSPTVEPAPSAAESSPPAGSGWACAPTEVRSSVDGRLFGKVSVGSLYTGSLSIFACAGTGIYRGQFNRIDPAIAAGTIDTLGSALGWSYEGVVAGRGPAVVNGALKVSRTLQFSTCVDIKIGCIKHRRTRQKLRIKVWNREKDNRTVAHLTRKNWEL